ncbi:hypothetical protein CEXT_580711 [Caerostris extrusa]|uniref:Uncharacterized protein n=1 Tax=Caerostris extrusa TaxID=172846 RepID=A0AAV4V210_CAEEX|nr:hypothetical protein CEXT_580711 [Caerostris extrusa]
MSLSMLQSKLLDDVCNGSSLHSAIPSKAACTEFAQNYRRPNDTVNEFRIVINSKKNGPSKLMAIVASVRLATSALKNGMLEEWRRFLTSVFLVFHP